MTEMRFETKAPAGLPENKAATFGTEAVLDEFGRAFEAFKEAMMELGDSGHSPAPSAAPVAVPGAPTPVPSQFPVPTPAPTNYPTVGKG